ncbi:MAG: hypothetical protein PVG55_00975 [Nitrospirota bacterium]|jgi:hypothetical protein
MPYRILLVALAVFFVACAGQTQKTKTYEPEMVQHIKGSVFDATDKGYYTTELVIKPSPPVVGDNKAQLIIHDYKATDIPGLDITIVPYLPEKDLESTGGIKVFDAGRGLYLIDNINFSEPGNWQLKLTISGPEMTDTVVLDIPEVKE